MYCPEGQPEVRPKGQHAMRYILWRFEFQWRGVKGLGREITLRVGVVGKLLTAAFWRPGIVHCEQLLLGHGGGELAVLRKIRVVHVAKALRDAAGA